MTKNITLRIDEDILKKCRYAAVEQEKSLSMWVSDLLKKVVSEKDQFPLARKRALKRMDKGIHLGGTPLKRDEIYER